MAISLDPKKLTRDAEKIKRLFKTVGETTVVNSDITILFPKRFINKNLCDLDMVTTVIAYYAIIDFKTNTYAITLVPGFQTMKPSSISLYSIGGKGDEKSLYIGLGFKKDDVVVLNNTLVKNSDCLYHILSEFYINGNIPWYMNYEDISNILLECKKYTDTNIGNDPAGLEILASIVARDQNYKAYRETISSRNEIFTKPPYFVGLNNVMAYDNTGSKLIGNYFGDGLTSALIDQETHSSDSSKLLRS